MSYIIPVLLGSAREGRVSDKAAAYMVSKLKERGAESSLIDPRDYMTGKSLELTSPKPWSDIMQSADALVIVSPEYNHGYPGELKELIDSCKAEYVRKPVAICGASAGGLGGARVVEQLRQVMIELRMSPIREALYFSDHFNLWNEDGSIKDPSYDTRVQPLLDELLWYTQALQEARKNIAYPSKK